MTKFSNQNLHKSQNRTCFKVTWLYDKDIVIYYIILYCTGDEINREWYTIKQNKCFLKSLKFMRMKFLRLHIALGHVD